MARPTASTHGIGAHATRATVMTGSATHVAALEAARHSRSKSRPQLLQAPADELTIVDGTVLRKGTPAGRRSTLGEIAKALGAGLGDSLAGRAPGSRREGWFHTEHMTYPYGVHAAVVRHRSRHRRASTVERYLIAYDVGRAVNPMLVEGQLVGGFAQGLGGALFEEFVYDDRGEPLVDHLRRLSRCPPHTKSRRWRCC